MKLENSYFGTVKGKKYGLVQPQQLSVPIAISQIASFVVDRP